MILNVHIFQNGMVAVFNENGQQIAHLQGRWEEKREEILKEATKNTNFYNTSWHTGQSSKIEDILK